MNESSNPLVETVSSNPVLNSKMRSTLVVQKEDSPIWANVLWSYKQYIDSITLVDLVLAAMFKSGEDRYTPVFEVLSKIRDEERRNLELRAAFATKGSPIDVTEEYSLSYADTLSDKDATLRRIALSSCKKQGRRLLQKWHPDKEGGDEEVFNLCKTAIDSGDVELVQILLYRFGEKNTSLDFDPIRVARIIQARTVKFRGSQLFRVFSNYVHSREGQFVDQLIALLNRRLNELQLSNIPGATPPDEPEESEDEPANPT